jgi:hypothetical protein
MISLWAVGSGGDHVTEHTEKVTAKLRCSVRRRIIQVCADVTSSSDSNSAV